MRYLILSDIHANLVALEAVLQAVDLNAIDEVWCLGDVVGYGPNPNECVDRMRELATVCLVGNHDWAALGNIDPEEFNDFARKALEWTQEKLTPESLAFLESLEGRQDHVHPDFTLAHGSPRNPIWEYLLYPTSAAENFAFFETRFCLVGHTHKPMIFQQEIVGPEDYLIQAFLPSTDVGLPIGQLEDVRLIINPGSVGQPRDQDPRAAYAIYDDDGGEFTFYRVGYDIGETQWRMEKAGLPKRLVERLAYGW
ncbi:MAG: metallophosphoesterase family protein [Ardenticatenaceae bacterium]